MRPLVLLALPALPGCALFRACAEPGLPDETQDRPVDTGGNDSGRADSGPVDTGPPPPCDQPEVEPNNLADEAQHVELDLWACGALAEAGDFDALTFETEEAGWLRVWVRGADIGSSADLQLFLYDADDGSTAWSFSSPGSTDPLLVVPDASPGTWYAFLSDEYLGYGEDHEWRLIAGSTKPPVEWTVVEGGENGSMEEGQALSSGDRVLGIIEDPNDRDWYLVEVPEGGKTTITLTMDAWKYGSPIDGRVRLYDSSGEKVAGRTYGATTADRDPAFEYTTSEPGTYGILVTDFDGHGSPLYWYVLEVTLETEPLDTGAGG